MNSDCKPVFVLGFHSNNPGRLFFFFPLLSANIEKYKFSGCPFLHGGSVDLLVFFLFVCLLI